MLRKKLSLRNILIALSLIPILYSFDLPKQLTFLGKKLDVLLSNKLVKFFLSPFQIRQIKFDQNSFKNYFSLIISRISLVLLMSRFNSLNYKSVSYAKVKFFDIFFIANFFLVHLIFSLFIARVSHNSICGLTDAYYILNRTMSFRLTFRNIYKTSIEKKFDLNKILKNLTEPSFYLSNVDFIIFLLVTFLNFRGGKFPLDLIFMSFVYFLLIDFIENYWLKWCGHFFSIANFLKQINIKLLRINRGIKLKNMKKKN